MGSIKILLADPDKSFTKEISDKLRQKGFVLTKAESLDQARLFLQDEWFHFIVVNINMANPDDPLDASGLQILRNQSYSAIPKFVIANFPTVSITREVLKPSTDGKSLAVDFLGKDAGTDSIIAAVLEAINKHVKINWDLIIRQKDVPSLIQLTQIIFPGITNQQVITRTEELENLLRTIFIDVKQITTGKLLLYKHGLAIVDGTVHGNEAKNMLLTCSDANRVLLQDFENNNHEPISKKQTYSSLNFTVQIDFMHDVNRISSFPDFFISSSIEEVLDSTKKLIDSTYYELHNKKQQVVQPEQFDHYLSERMRGHLEQLECAIIRLSQASLISGISQLSLTNGVLTFHLPDSQNFSYPNPTLLIDRFLHVSANSAILFGLTYGDISGSSIQIDDAGNSIIIGALDFEYNPVILDFVSLEMIIKHECLLGADICDRFEMEKRLIEGNTENFGKPILQKSMQCIQLIRNHFQLSNSIYLEVLLCSLVASLASFQNDIEYTSDELTVFLHDLLSAAIIMDQLIKDEKVPVEAFNGLWIDLESKEVWVEGNRISLTPQELDILIYLYKNAGEQRSRQMIINNAMNNPDASVTSYQQETSEIIEESRLNSAMSRLRLKIERDPENPKYLHTVRGIGYRLEIR